MKIVLTEMTRGELEEKERIIERGIQTFMDVGLALMEVHDRRGYKAAGYATFGEYCQRRWGWGRNYANKLIAASGVIANLGTIVPILPATESQARPLTALEPDQQREAWRRAVETAPDGNVTAAHVQRAVDGIRRPVSYHVSDDSYEWYTPKQYTEAARKVLGEIDLDPASTAEANKVVRAKRFYTRDEDGLTQRWSGRVWLNPPYNMPLIEQFVVRAMAEYECGNVTAAVILTNNSTDTLWFHRLLAYPVCLTRGRIQFENGDERLATRQGQALFYLGKNGRAFAREFAEFGAVMVRYDHRK